MMLVMAMTLAADNFSVVVLNKCTIILHYLDDREPASGVSASSFMQELLCRTFTP